MKKLALYEKLGALKFKKVVLKVEELKFKLTKPFYKKIINLNDKLLDKKLNKMLKKENNDENRKMLIRYFNREKLRARIEYNNNENRNYHFNTLNPNETLNYLNINKKIHINGIKSNLLYIAISTVGIIFIKSITIPLIISISLNCISIFINFECINLQNYNITRIEQKLEKLTKIRKHKLSQKIKLYKNISKSLAPLLERDKKVPSKEDIVECIQTKEETLELELLIEHTIKSKERKLKLWYNH